MSRWLVPAWAFFLAALALGPSLGPGLVLSYDMSFVPEPTFSWDQLGLGAQLPRAVPLDAVTTAASWLVTASVVQKAALVGGLVAAGWGSARLVESLPVGARLVAVTVAVWNPYVAERLVLGHWGLLLAYGALPWLVRSLLLGPGGSLPLTVVQLGVCALTPTGGLLSLAVLAVAWTRAGGSETRRHLLVTGLAWLLVNAPWWLPGLLRGGSTVVDPASVEAFAVRPEVPGGLLPTVLGLGGIWNAEVVLASRSSPLAVASLGVLLALALVGSRRCWRSDRGATARLALLAGIGLVLALLGAVPGTSALLEWLVAEVPGLGLLRDGQKFLALAVPCLVVLVATGADEARVRLGSAGGQVVVAGAVLLPVALLPDLAWGAGGRLEATSYPAAWAEVREAVAGERAPGDLLLLPWSAFRAYRWNDDRTVLDPARRAFPRRVLGDDRLAIGTTVLASEDPRSRAVLQALRRDQLDAGRLRDLGVRLVLVQDGQPGQPRSSTARPRGTTALVRTPELRLLRVSGPVHRVARPVGPTGTVAVVAFDVLALAVVAGAALAAVIGRRRRDATESTRSRETHW